MARAVITGLGAVTPIGNTVADYWGNLIKGVSGVGPITQFDPAGLNCRIAAEVKGFDPAQYMEARTAKRMARFSQFAVATARQAVEDAGLTIDDGNRQSVAVVMNTGGGGIYDTAEGERVLLEKGPDRVSPFLVPILAANMASCQVAMEHGIHGPAITSAAACASGVYSFIEAKQLLDLGVADAVITGGTEANLHPLAFAAFDNMRALSRRNDDPEKACRPFDLDRDGFVFGEGAGAMVIETLEHAQRRGARIYAELCGGSMTSDAYHITAPEPTGAAAARAMTLALKASGMDASEIDYVAAHGTGTSLNDAAETKAIKTALGAHAHKIAVSSPKSMVGHLLGGAGMASGIAAILAIRDGVIPPTANLETPDPECDLDYVPLQARKTEVRAAMINGFGFGGQNASVVFRRFEV